MSFASLLPQTGERFARTTGSADRYGNDSHTYPGTATASYPCRLRRLKAEERTQADGREVVSHKLYLASDAVIDRHDRWRVEGVFYEVNGTPYEVRGEADVHHIEADLVAVT